MRTLRAHFPHDVVVGKVKIVLACVVVLSQKFLSEGFSAEIDLPLHFFREFAGRLD